MGPRFNLARLGEAQMILYSWKKRILKNCHQIVKAVKYYNEKKKKLKSDISMPQEQDKGGNFKWVCSS